MRCNSHALYSCLVEDLSRHLPPDVIVQLEQGQEVEDWPDMTLKQTACLYLVRSFYKKFVDRTTATADKAALEKFLSVNDKVGSWCPRPERLRDELLLGELRKEVYNFFYPKGDPLVNTFAQIFEHGRTGPGSSIAAHGSDFYTKLFSSPLSTTTMGLYEAYLNCIQRYPDWSAAEGQRFSKFGEPVTVPGNKLNFVPKNVDTSRIIATEPSLNMFFQLGLGRIIEDRLVKVFGINLSIQPDNNRELARIGSVDGTYCTIDLSSASDSVSMGLAEYLIPRDQLAWFKLFRSPETLLPSKEVVQLNMLSTMGNGYTFPLQTALFTCIIAAAFRVFGLRMERPRGDSTGNFAAFGDDLIVPTEMYETVKRLLELCGFTLNDSKSFYEGLFRESCGADFLSGSLVRGVYISTLKTQESRYVAINRLNHWSAITGIKLPNTVQYLLKRVAFMPVPLWENDDAGLKVPFSMVRRLRRDRHVQSVLYRRRVVVPKKLRILDGTILVPKGERARFYNGPGLLLAYLNGVVRKSTIGVRLDAQRYSTKFAVAPTWDSLILPNMEDFATFFSMALSSNQHLKIKAREVERVCLEGQKHLISAGRPVDYSERLKAAIRLNLEA